MAGPLRPAMSDEDLFAEGWVGLLAGLSVAVFRVAAFQFWCSGGGDGLGGEAAEVCPVGFVLRGED